MKDVYYINILFHGGMFIQHFLEPPSGQFTSSQLHVVNNATVDAFSLNISGNFLGWNPNESPDAWSYFKFSSLSSALSWPEVTGEAIFLFHVTTLTTHQGECR